MDNNAIRLRLDALITAAGEDYASLSRLLGRNPTYIQQFIKRGVPRRLSEDDRRVLAQRFGIAERLLGGPEEHAGRAVMATMTPTTSASDFVLIPHLNVGASAGAGALTDAEAPIA